MVYLGPSRGCQTCRRRRKKCDETRPSCTRCTESDRTCGGYEEDASWIFRQHEGGDRNAPPFKSIARKCSLPVRVSPSGSGSLPEDEKPKEMSEEQVEDLSLRAFVHDYCTIPINQSICRGYLHSLEPMLHSEGMRSDLAKACQAVAFASHGISLRRPLLTTKAETLYQYLLQSVRQAVSNTALVAAPSTLMIIILLGLYEMVVASETRPGMYATHVQGLAAIDGSRFGLGIAGPSLFGRPGNTIQGAFSIPGVDGIHEPLDTLLVTFDALCGKADPLITASCSMPGPALHQLRLEALTLNERLVRWGQSRVPQFWPQTVGQWNRAQEGRNADVGQWPGNVDLYPDLYIAAVWNVFRVARIKLLHIAQALSELVGDDTSGHSKAEWTRDAISLAEATLASIPYHLAQSVEVFLHADNKDGNLEPGRPVSGLVLMHPLFIASNLSILPPVMRDYMKRCLTWIGVHMGIGQATLFAKTTDLGTTSVDNGSFLVWAGFFV